MINEPEQVINQMVVADSSQVAAVVRMFARVIVNDCAETAGELVQEQRVDVIARGNPRDEEERRTLSQDSVGHPVPGSVPAADFGRPVVTGRFLTNPSGSRARLSTGFETGRFGCGRRVRRELRHRAPSWSCCTGTASATHLGQAWVVLSASAVVEGASTA